MCYLFQGISRSIDLGYFAPRLEVYSISLTWLTDTIRPVGSGKTALMLALCHALRDEYNIAAVTNDIFTRYGSSPIQSP